MALGLSMHDYVVTSVGCSSYSCHQLALEKSRAVSQRLYTTWATKKEYNGELSNLCTGLESCILRCTPREYFVAFWEIFIKNPILFDGNSAAVLQKTWGFPAEMGKAEIDGAMSGPDPATFWTGRHWTKKLLKKCRFFPMRKTQPIYLSSDPVFWLPHLQDFEDSHLTIESCESVVRSKCIMTFAKFHNRWWYKFKNVF